MADLASRTHSYNTRQKYKKLDAHQRKERSFSCSFLFAWALSTLVARAQWAGEREGERTGACVTSLGTIYTVVTESRSKGLVPIWDMCVLVLRSTLKSH